MRRMLAALAAAAALPAATALAHEGDPDYESVVRSAPDGVRATVLNGDDRLELVNAGRRDVVVLGYEREPYARLRPGGAVEVNRLSPATYLNDDRFGKVDVPEAADPKAAPAWRRAGGAARFEFHDHRIHWMNPGVPPAVKDRDRRTKVYDWSVPLRVDGRAAEVTGTLWWKGSGGDEGGISPIALGAMGALVLGSLALLVVRQRRRRGGGGGVAW